MINLRCILFGHMKLLKEKLYNFKAFLLNKRSGYTRRVIIEIGLNGEGRDSTNKEIEEIQNTIRIKLYDYLKQYPHNIKAK